MCPTLAVTAEQPSEPQNLFFSKKAQPRFSSLVVLDMALFFNFKAQCPKAETTNVVWHPVLPVLAVATVSGSVHICSDEGDRVEANIARPHSASTSLAWHPTQKLLCVGWRDGAISWWAACDPATKEPATKEADAVHEQATIVAAEWAPSGSHFVSADAAGFIVVWRMDTRGRLLTKIKISLGASVVSSIVFLDKNRISAQTHNHDKAPPIPEAVEEGSTEDSALESADPLLRGRVLSEDVVVLVGTEDGKIVLLDDIGNKQTLVAKDAIDGSAVRSMLMYNERNEIIVGTDKRTLARQIKGMEPCGIPPFSLAPITTFPCGVGYLTARGRRYLALTVLRYLAVVAVHLVQAVYVCTASLYISL